MAGNRPGSYPNLVGKHAYEALVTPAQKIDYVRSIGLLDGMNVPAGVIFCFQRLVVNHCLRTEGLEGPRPGTMFRGLVTLPSTGHRVGVLGGFGYGAPTTTLLMEEFIELGVTKFISVGTAGSIQPAARAGDIVVAQRAIRDEGVSHHYQPPAKYAEASTELTARLSAELAERTLVHRVGSSWTIDAPYRETREEARRYQLEGVLAVEMEAAALFAVAAYRSVQATSVLVISDLLGDGSYRLEFHSDADPAIDGPAAQVAERLRQLFDAAVATLDH